MNSCPLQELTIAFAAQEAEIRKGGGKRGEERQKRLGRLTVRERLNLLLDDAERFFELNLWAAYGMYEEWGGVPAAGVITGIGKVSGRLCMVIANDATVKAGALFPQSVKKVLRAQKIAFACRLPVLYLVDSSGVFLPLQDEIFPDEDDFGRIFRNNALFSQAGIPQFAAIMGSCIAGGGYLPVLCDQLLMTEGSGLYIAGPALVKAAIGQEIDPETLGGATLHAEVSGTVDFHEPDDKACLKRLRSLVDLLPPDPLRQESGKAAKTQEMIYETVSGTYDVREMLACIVDQDSIDEYKASYGKTLVTAYAKIGGMPVGIVASQRAHSKTAKGEVEIGGVIYSESAEKAARFMENCDQMRVPLLFFQDVSGFMVGKEAEESGIIRNGAKMVRAVSTVTVPKITVITGSAFGAGHYVLCGKAYDPNFVIAWPNAQYAVMGADQAARTLLTVQEHAAKKSGKPFDKEGANELYQEIKEQYEAHTDIRYGAARGWVDALTPPHQTRATLIDLLQVVQRAPPRQWEV